jgi:hypothetical protein
MICPTVTGSSRLKKRADAPNGDDTISAEPIMVVVSVINFLRFDRARWSCGELCWFMSALVD